jgi:threonine dehydrogenase-like Zn-dependent dehydrogenase
MLTEPPGFDCVIGATGIASVIEDAYVAVKRAGTLIIFGVVPHNARILLSPGGFTIMR